VAVVSDPTFDKVAQEVDTAEREILRVLSPSAQWRCSGCGQNIDHADEPFTADDLRNQIHLPQSWNTINLAMHHLIDAGVLKLDSRWRLSVDQEARIQRVAPRGDTA
jgi:hypothetical protein